MKTKAFKSFLIAVFLIAVFSTIIPSLSSCGTTALVTHPRENVTIVEKKLGESGFTVKAGTSIKPSAKYAWVSIVANLDKVSENAKKKLSKWFPQISKELNSIQIKQ